MTDPANEKRAQRELPMTFGSFLLSLGSTALVHLGELADPGTGLTQRDLTVARQTIDLLEVLQVKTAGNLDDDEKKLMETLLYELRIKFLAARQGGE